MQITHCDYPKCDFQVSGVQTTFSIGSMSRITISHPSIATKQFDLCPKHIEAIGLSLKPNPKAKDVDTELLEKLAEFVQDEISNSSI